MIKSFRFAIGQLNPTVGDFSQNSKKIISAIAEADSRGADLIVFPEMAICGYPVWDLANQKQFIDQGIKSLNAIAAATRGLRISVILGYIDYESRQKGRSQNALAWISNGRVIDKYVKQLLPTYDVFLEQIFFTPGKSDKLVRWRGMKVGLTICEDIWDENYDSKPLTKLSHLRPDLVVNISASPFYGGVSQVREALVRRQCRKYGFPLLYVNQIGGQDDLIFDGSSFFADARGNTVFRAPAFKEGVFYFDWGPAQKRSASLKPVSLDRDAETYQALVFSLKDYCRKNNFYKALIGLSGGIDSALVAAIAVDALGPEAVLGVTMPSRFSSKGSWQDSYELARRLSIQCLHHPIKARYDFMMKENLAHKAEDFGVRQSPRKITLAMENLQARLRGLELMYLSNDQGRLLLTTGNKSELAMGYCTLYGDMAGGLAVIGDLFKTEVYRLARYRNSIGEVIPRCILEKAPSAELRPNQKDQDSLPPYELLDAILRLYIEENKSAGEIVRAVSKREFKKNLMELVCKVIRQVNRNEYKRRQTPPILRVTRKAWFGRRMPITNRFEP